MSTVAIVFYLVLSGHMVAAPYPVTQTNVAKSDCQDRAQHFNAAEIKTTDGKRIYAYCLIDEPGLDRP